MTIKQIAVFLENKQGRMAKFSKVLCEAGVNIQTLSIADTEDFGIVRTITDNNDLAVKKLRENGFNTSITELVGFEVPDKPGEMAKVLKVLEDADINISYLYSFALQCGAGAVILIKVPNNEKALKVLKDNNIKLASYEQK
jgi:hypothetical protein